MPDKGSPLLREWAAQRRVSHSTHATTRAGDTTWAREPNGGLKLSSRKAG